MALLLAAIAAAPLAAGHVGYSCDLAGNRLEGECYTIPDAGCDPDGDGEHTRITPDAGDSNGASGEAPSQACGLNFRAYFPVASAATGFRAGVVGASGTFTSTLFLSVDGAAYAQQDFVDVGGGDKQVVAFGSAGTIPAGWHDLRVTASIGGPGYMGLVLDYVDFAFTTACSDGIDNDGDGSVDYPADPDCQSPSDPSEDANCDEAAPGVLACVQQGPRVVGADLHLVEIGEGPAHHAAGYVDAYRFQLPGGGSIVLPCVTLIADGSPVNPCAAAGGTFVARAFGLEQPASEPTVQEGERIATVGVCQATVTVAVLGFGLHAVPAYTVC